MGHSFNRIDPLQCTAILNLDPEGKPCSERLTTWSHSLSLPTLSSPSLAHAIQTHGTSHPLVLLCPPNAPLALQRLRKKPPHPISIDIPLLTESFLTNRGSKILNKPKLNGGYELLLKACGLKKDHSLFVLDATAGLCRDATFLAKAGCHVYLSERHPIIHAMISDAISFGSMNHNRLVERLELLTGDASQILETMDAPDVIYLDPMLPPRKKSSKVKEEMQMLQEMIGEDLDCYSLYQLARTKAKKRVVVKRPLSAPPLDTSQKPGLVLKGQSTRFDVYFTPQPVNELEDEYEDDDEGDWDDWDEENEEFQEEEEEDK